MTISSEIPYFSRNGCKRNQTKDIGEISFIAIVGLKSSVLQKKNLFFHITNALLIRIKASKYLWSVNKLFKIQFILSCMILSTAVKSLHFSFCAGTAKRDEA